jgi:hypothetical protein
VRLLVEYGQRTGELREYPPAAEVSGMIISLLLTRAVEVPRESPEQTTRLLLTMLFGPLRPQSLPCSGERADGAVLR